MQEGRSPYSTLERSNSSGSRCASTDNARTDIGHSVIKVPGEEACYDPYHSGVVDNTGRHGAAIAFSEAAQAALLAWVPITSRLASARFKGTTVNLTVIAVYA